MKIIAYYLPQYHTFPENDEWWGEGFTEWTNVKQAKPLFEGHCQPKVPYLNNYYNLLDEGVLKWQASLAKKYGIYGFSFYHYWFDGKMLMNQPMELLLKDKEIDLRFCICWANENWTKSWAKRDKTILISQNYKDENDWIKHFEYLYPFFVDSRYIKLDGKPIIIIHRPELIPTLRKMINCWKRLANEKGLSGLTFIYQCKTYNHLKEPTGDLFDYGIEDYPGYARNIQNKQIKVIARKLLNMIVTKFNIKQTEKSTLMYQYDDTWRTILNMTPRDDKMIPGAMVNWDNTPRYKNSASMEKGYTTEKFQKYLSMQIERARKIYKKDIIFLFAWNEWGEGGYMEPDSEEGFARLEAVKNALIVTNEFE